MWSAISLSWLLHLQLGCVLGLRASESSTKAAAAFPFEHELVPDWVATGGCLDYAWTIGHYWNIVGVSWDMLEPRSSTSIMHQPDLSLISHVTH